MKKKQNIKRILLIAAAFALIAVILVYIMQPESLKTEIIQVRQGNLVVEVSDVGQTRFRHISTVLAPQSSWISAFHVASGTTVTAAISPLLTLTAARAPLIDSRTRAALKAQAEASKAREAQAREQFKKIAINLSTSESALQRAERVLMSGGVSLQEIEQLRAQVSELRAEQRSTQALLEVLRHSTEAAQWAFQTQDQNSATEKLIVKAPLSGIVTWIYNEKPRFVQLGEPLLDIAIPGQLYVEVELLVRDSLLVRPGQNVRFEEIPLTGKVRALSPTAQPKVSPLGISEQRVRVWIDFDNAVEEHWPAGMELETFIEVRKEINTLIVPLSAVWNEGDVSYVYQVDNNTLKRRKVNTGFSSENEIEIRSGLLGQETLVRFPSSSMFEGQKLSTGI